MKQTCIVCKESKPVTQFFKDKNTISGYRGKCKVCHNAKRTVKPKEPIEIVEIRNEIKLLSSKNKDRLDKVICKIGSLKMAYGYKPVYDELLNVAYNKMSKTLRARNQ